MLHLPSIGTEEMSQNQNHMHRLELTRADFKTCFPVPSYTKPIATALKAKWGGRPTDHLPNNFQ